MVVVYSVSSSSLNLYHLHHAIQNLLSIPSISSDSRIYTIFISRIYIDGADAVLKCFATGTTFYVQPMPMARRPGQSAIDVLYRDEEVAHRWVEESRVVGYLFDIKVWFFGAFSCSE